MEVFAQQSLSTLIDNATGSNKTYMVAQQLYEAEVMRARTGNSPDNPLVEYTYLWGTPEQLGDRVDLAVTQSFDFPTTYSSRNKLSKINRDQARLKLEVAEQDIVVQARQAWITAVYLNKRTSLLSKRLDNAIEISRAMQRLFEEGEASILELNQSNLKVTSLTNEMRRLEMDRVSNEVLIKRLNGGVSYEIYDSIFPVSMDIELDTLIRWYNYGPQNSAFRNEVERQKQAKDVAFNQKLPKMFAGYYQESILGTQLKGIRTGITIPLWENANAVKSAKESILYAESNALRYWEQQELRVRQLFEQWKILGDQVSKMQELLENSNNDALLLKALEGGEISLTQYYYQSDFYFQNQFDLFDLQRDLHLIEAELLRVTY
jgi:hypothetical protein